MDENINNRANLAESSDFDPVDLVSLMLKNLLKREQDVVKRRFSLTGNARDTLEQIGKEYSITRERVRQIEVSGLKKLRSFIKDEKEKLNASLLQGAVQNILNEYGGLMREDLLLMEMLSSFSKTDNEIYRKNLLFLIIYLFEDDDSFLKVDGNHSYEPFWYANFLNVDEIRVSIEKIIEFFLNHGKPLEFDRLAGSIDLKMPQIKSQENIDNEKLKNFINAHLHVSKKVERNILDQWGLVDWKTVVPKRMNDKIYLVLKRETKPLHFAEIAQRINEMKFDKKFAYPATVHNELILDKKYILVGRGVYALREWGYNDGTVSEVIEAILKKENKPLEKREIINKVLKERMVRKTTVALALNDRAKFQIIDGKYILV